MPDIYVTLDWVPEVYEVFPDGAPDSWTKQDVIDLIREDIRQRGVAGWLRDWGLLGEFTIDVGGVRVSS